MTKKELFVGNLGKEVSKRDVEDLFDKYGKIIRCDVKSKDFGNSFCFLEFEDERDAEVNMHFNLKKKINFFIFLFNDFSLILFFFFNQAFD